MKKDWALYIAITLACIIGQAVIAVM